MKNTNFVEITSLYEGELIRTDNELIFKSKNHLKHSFNCEINDSIQFITETRKIECSIVFDELNDTLRGEESTCEIIGGFGLPHSTTSDLIKQLERYNFRKRDFIPLV